MDQAISALEQLTGKRWSAIRSAAETSHRILEDLEKSVDDLADPNIAVVVTGSLGRGEATPDSDADWFLLIDGPSNPDHAVLAHEVDRRVKGVVPKAVGPTGTFAGIVTSHELVHYIAGNKDTNENLTRRILLLSESHALSNDLVRQRVIRNVLSRYIIHDRSVRSASGNPHTIPHFFLNDIVRYWRTMASDYASKMWDRERKGWGIRNIKLRFSRKLLFLWGLLAAFSGELFPNEEMLASADEDEYLRLLAELIREQTDVTPLSLLARIVLETQDTAISDDIFSSYDEFLAVLADAKKRDLLEKVDFEQATSDPTYDALRQLSSRFREGVTTLFFDRHPRLPDLIRKYGVF
ncbi:MAG TPA: nucleotidyltransferase domain-containing protein [Thermoanaerobaculia bacterium]